MATRMRSSGEPIRRSMVASWVSSPVLTDTPRLSREASSTLAGRPDRPPSWTYDYTLYCISMQSGPPDTAAGLGAALLDRCANAKSCQRLEEGPARADPSIDDV